MSEQASLELGGKEETSSEETIYGDTPSDWRSASLDDGRFFEVLGSGVREFSGMKNYLSTSCVEGFQIVDVEEEVTYDNRPSRANLQPQNGGVVFAKMKDSIKVLSLDEELANNYILSTGFVQLVPQEVNSEYLKQILLSHRFNQVKDSVAIGSTQPAITLSDLHHFEVPIPPLPEQRKIASVLYTVDQAIQQTEAIIAQIERVKQGIMQDIFRVGVKPDGSLRGSPENQDLYRDTKYGPVPQDWDVVPLNDLVPDDAPIVYGILKPGDHQSGGVPVIKVENIHDGQIKDGDLLHTAQEIHENFKRAELQAGDLLFTIRGTVGRMAFVPDHLEGGNITQDTARIRIKDANPKFIRYYLETYTPSNYFERHTIGQAVQGINLEDLREVPVHLPSEEEQERIVRIIDSYSERLQTERNYLNRFRQMKKGLMQDLLTGAVRTKDRDVEVVDAVWEVEE